MAFIKKWILPAWWIFFIGYQVYLLALNGWKSNEFVFGRMIFIIFGMYYLCTQLYKNYKSEKNSSAGS